MSDILLDTGANITLVRSDLVPEEKMRWIPPRGMLFCKTREEIPREVVRLKDQGAESGRLEDEKVSWFEILPGAEIAVLDELWEERNPD